MTNQEKDLRDTLCLEKDNAGNINYSVVAGAGAGKTTMLSRRIGNQIMDGLSLDQFIIITYTNAAAAELRDKITSHLENLRDSNLTEQQKMNVEEALASIELIQISTIHSFLFKIIKEHAFESGFTIDGQLLEEQEDLKRKELFFDKWFSDAKNQATINSIRPKWTLEVESSHSMKDFTHDVMLQMFSDMANIRENVVYNTNITQNDLDVFVNSYVQEWFPVLDQFVTQLNNLITSANVSKTLKAANDVIQNHSRVKLNIANNTISKDDADSISVAIKIAKDAIRSWNNKTQTHFFEKASQSVEIKLVPYEPAKNVSDKIWKFSNLEKMLDKAADVAELAAIIDKVCKEYQNMIDQDTMFISNDDILYRAEKLLSTYPDILNETRGKYKKIYVDEFQDTTNLQTKIMKLISSKVNVNSSNFDLEDDKLLVVGDPKQSIYRFTGAEKSIFDDVHRDMKALANGAGVELEANFRSNSDIVKWVNNSFNVLMGASYSPMQNDWKVTESEALHGVYQYEGDNTYKIDEDVKAVVGIVEKLTDNEKFFLQKHSYDVNSGTHNYSLGKIKYSDFMILTKDTREMSKFVKSFAEKGIPVNVQGKFQISDDTVLNNYVSILAFLTNTKKKMNRIQAAQIFGEFDIVKKEPSVLKQFVDQLYEIKNDMEKCGLGIPAIAQEIYLKEELYLPKDVVLTKERVREYKIRIHQMIESCLLKNTGDLNNLVILMKEYLENDVKREIPLESNENAIQLMNVHQAKGLTGQIVIIADRFGEEKPRYSAYRSNGNYYPVATVKKSEENKEIYPSFAYDYNHMKDVIQAEEEESIRLQYVAATRAAQALIIMPSGKTKNAWFSQDAYKLSEQNDLQEWIAEREADEINYNIGQAVLQSSSVAGSLLDLSKAIGQVDKDQIALSSILNVTPSGLEPKMVTGNKPGDDGYVKEDRPSGAILGTILHRVYELIFRRYHVLKDMSDREKAIEKIVRQALREQDLVVPAFDEENKEESGNSSKVDIVNYLCEIMDKYWDTVIEPIAQQADEIYPEYEFSFYVSEEEKDSFIQNFGAYLKEADETIELNQDRIWVNGQADLVVKNKDGSIKVYDYKSDAMNGKPYEQYQERLNQKYSGQLALYRYAIAKAFGVQEVSTELIHLYR